MQITYAVVQRVAKLPRIVAENLFIEGELQVLPTSTI